MTGGIGDEKLSGRSGISFDIINESENFPILEIFFVDRFGLYRMRIGQIARNNRVECREKRPTVFQESRS